MIRLSSKHPLMLICDAEDGGPLGYVGLDHGVWRCDPEYALGWFESCMGIKLSGGEMRAIRQYVVTAWDVYQELDRMLHDYHRPK